MAGVVEVAVSRMRVLGADEIYAALGPCIRPHAYRFSAADIEAVAAHFGPRVQASDADGYPALDLPAAVGAALENAGAVLIADAGTCTHCSEAHWSWRARADAGRQATVVWRAVGPGQ
jgi:polyphenol oxidase